MVAITQTEIQTQIISTFQEGITWGATAMVALAACFLAVSVLSFFLRRF
jgi:hypothetical protein